MDEEDETTAQSIIVKQVCDILKKIDSPGDFAVGAAAPMLSVPKLNIQGLGIVPLPVVDVFAKLLKTHMTQAPFGRGEDTVYDAAVRNSWQLEPSGFSIENPIWLKGLDDTVRTVAKELGCRDVDAVSAHLYKLLLYEAGGCFKPHRDSEKEPGMFATLVVVLPSIFSGGRLVVRHGEEERSFDFGEQSSNQAHYLAFFCDVEHELEVVTSGYRLCVVYNLVIDTGTPKPVPVAEPGVALRLSQTLTLWNEITLKNEPPKRIIIALDHKYTEAHLSIAHLKGRDQAIGQIFQRVASATNTIVSLVTLQKEISDDAEDGGDEENISYAISSVAISDTGKNFPWEISSERYNSFSFRVDSSEIVNPLAFGRKDLFDSHVEHTGNEGTTRTLWYRKAALIVFPRIRLLATRLGHDNETSTEINATLNSFRSMDPDQRMNDSNFKMFTLSIQVCIAALLLRHHKLFASVVSDMISLGDWACFEAFINNRKVTEIPASSVVQVFLAAIATRGWAVVQPFLLEKFVQSKKNPLTTLQVLNLTANAHDEIKVLHRDYLKEVVSNLSLLDTLKSKDDHLHHYYRRDEDKPSNVALALQQIVHAFAFEEDCLERVFDYTFAGGVTISVLRDALVLCEYIAKENRHVATTSSHCLNAYNKLIDVYAKNIAASKGYDIFRRESRLANRLLQLLLTTNADQALQDLFNQPSIIWEDQRGFVDLLKQHYSTDPRVHTLVPTIISYLKSSHPLSGSNCDADLVVFALATNNPELFDLLFVAPRSSALTSHVLQAIVKPTGWAHVSLQLVKSAPRFLSVLRVAADSAVNDCNQKAPNRRRQRPVVLQYPHLDLYMYTLVRLNDPARVTSFYEQLVAASAAPSIVRSSIERLLAQHPEFAEQANILKPLLNPYPHPTKRAKK